MGQRGGLGEVVAVERRNHAQTGQSLEAVANTDNEFAVIDKLLELVAQIEFDAVGENSSGTEVVTERKSADKSEKMELVQIAFSGEQIVEVDQFRGGTGKFSSGGGLFFTVQTEPGDDQHFDI